MDQTADRFLLEHAHRHRESRAEFTSILFGDQDGNIGEGEVPEPACFGDLNLDQIVSAAVQAKAAYDLTPFFHQKLSDIDIIAYRHEVFRDLEKTDVSEAIDRFAAAMQAMRERLRLAEKSGYRYQKEAFFLEAARDYCDAIYQLARDLQKVKLGSRGLIAFRSYLFSHISGPDFSRLETECEALRHELADIRYSLLIKAGSVQVRDYEGESDYSESVTATFEKFQQGQTEDYAKMFPAFTEMNHIEAGILSYVAKLNPGVFATLDKFCSDHSSFVDPVIARFDREVQFYIAWLEHIAVLKSKGLKFSYPLVSTTSKEISGKGCFDIGLAIQLVREDTKVVVNDFHLKGKERIFVVYGPNQGGKTTFARMIGQLHYLAALGCPVPGRETRLWLFDTIFSHFEREENVTSFHGKLEDDLIRIHDILQHATTGSLIIMNEIFTSTTLRDAIVLGRKVMGKIIALDCLCVCVTFIDELASLHHKVVSVVSCVVPGDPAKRTFKIVRKPANGKAYATFIAKRYGLTYSRIRRRVRS